MYRTDEARPIGLAALTEVGIPEGSAEFRTLIGDARDRGHGFGRESSELVLRFGFEELGLREIRLDVYGYNAAGLRLYERLGFREVERHPMKIERDGRRWDVIRMTRTPPSLVPATRRTRGSRGRPANGRRRSAARRRC